MARKRQDVLVGREGRITQGLADVGLGLVHLPDAGTETAQNSDSLSATEALPRCGLRSWQGLTEFVTGTGSEGPLQ